MTSLASRAAALERAGDWLAADRAYADGYERALRERDVAAAVDGLRRMANARFRYADADEAAELAELSAEMALRAGLRGAAARAWNVLAVIRHFTGELAAAESLYQSALELALEADDPETVGIVCQNLGVISNIRGDYRGARLLYLETIASFVRSGNRSAAMTAYNNLGMVCTDLGEWMEAEIYFGRGIEIAEQIDDLTMLTKLHGNRAEPLIRIGDFPAARACLDYAERCADQTNDVRAGADVNRYRGMIARLEGDYTLAESHVGRAIELCSGAELALERAEALEELARIRLAQQRRGAARVLIREAVERYRSVGADRDVARLLTATEFAPEAVEVAAAGGNSAAKG